MTEGKGRSPEEIGPMKRKRGPLPRTKARFLSDRRSPPPEIDAPARVYGSSRKKKGRPLEDGCPVTERNGATLPNKCPMTEILGATPREKGPLFDEYVFLSDGIGPFGTEQRSST
jgi:hypothetical protein